MDHYRFLMWILKYKAKVLSHQLGLPAQRRPGATRDTCGPITTLPGVSCSFFSLSFPSLLLLLLVARDTLVIPSSRAFLQVAFSHGASSICRGDPLRALSPVARALLSTFPLSMLPHCSPCLHLSGSPVGLFNSILAAVFIKDMTLNRTIQLYPKQSPGIV